MSLSGFPFPTVATTGDAIEALLLRMRLEQAPLTTLPVIIGDADSAKQLVELWDANALNLEEAMRWIDAANPGDWLRQRREEEPEAYTFIDEDEADPEEAQPTTRLAVGYNYKGKPLKEVFIARAPAADYWTLPLHLRFGDWNECPDPAAHAMMARYWEQRYGARIAVITSDTMEFTVAQPPMSMERCMELAREQYIYCADIVEQGVGSLSALAQTLQNAPRWYFWWD